MPFFYSHMAYDLHTMNIWLHSFLVSNKGNLFGPNETVSMERMRHNENINKEASHFRCILHSIRSHQHTHWYGSVSPSGCFAQAHIVYVCTCVCIGCKHSEWSVQPLNNNISCVPVERESNARLKCLSMLFFSFVLYEVVDGFINASKINWRKRFLV